MSNSRFYCLTIALLVLFLSACNLPTSTTPTAISANPAYTAAAETIVAQLTQIAGPATQTPATTPEMTAQPPAGAGTQSPEPTAQETVAPSATPTSATATLEVTPTPTPTLTLEVTGTITSTASPAPTSSDPRQKLGDPSWRDTFANSNNWPLYDDEHVKMSLKGGHLEMTALNADKWDSWMLSWPVLTNFYLEIAAQPGTCSGLDHYGLLARAPEEDEAYLFGFSCDGQYSLRRWDGKKFTSLVDWTSSSFIHAGADQANRLGFMAQGDRISLYANGNPLIEITDSTYEEGAFGLFIGSADTPDFKVQFSEIAYWDLP